jgi:protocatechuate 3,4-dioxygenase, beta subunit
MTNIAFPLALSLSLFTLVACHGQPPAKVGSATTGVVGGPFENGEFLYIGMPKNISSVDTSEGWNQKGQKLLITGTIYQLDGKTPAPNVILYYYHTDINGVYANRPGLDPRVVRHGYIRGWVKSDAQGKYTIYTVRPAPYPNRHTEAHIHPAIKEPDIEKEYYIDEFVFDDDKLLTGEKRRHLEQRGGSGILRVQQHGDLQVAQRDIILGLHIPNYPKTDTRGNESGLHIGEDQPSFTPTHAYGPDKGTKTCPVCKYGRFFGIIYFVGNKSNWNEIKKWVTFLDQLDNSHGSNLKTYFVYGNEEDSNKSEKLETCGQELGLKDIALTFVPSFSDRASEVNLNKINQRVTNTFIVYHNSRIINKFIDLEPTTENFELFRKLVSAR